MSRFVLLLCLGLSPALAAGPLQVFVSVAPQQYLLEQVGGEQVAAHVMVPPAHNPATYEPQPSQLAALERADLYLAIGVPFERAWLPRIRRAFPRLRVEDLRGHVDGKADGQTVEHGHHHHDGPDPHVWTDPLRCLRLAARIRDLLSELRPGHSARFEANYRALAERLGRLDAELRELLSGLSTRSFLVFHPAWGYFAERYGLEQIAIEHEGKEPGGRALAGLIERTRDAGIRAVFVQPQFSGRLAARVAEAIGARVVVADPLAGDCTGSLRGFAERLLELDPP